MSKTLGTTDSLFRPGVEMSELGNIGTIPKFHAWNIGTAVQWRQKMFVTALDNLKSFLFCSEKKKKTHTNKTAVSVWIMINSQNQTFPSPDPTKLSEVNLFSFCTGSSVVTSLLECSSINMVAQKFSAHSENFEASFHVPEASNLLLEQGKEMCLWKQVLLCKSFQDIKTFFR